VLQTGRLVERGTHEELMACGRVYFQLRHPPPAAAEAGAVGEAGRVFFAEPPGA